MSTVDGFTVLVVAKAPQPGRVKTRLCPPLTHDQAAAVAAAALLDSLAAAHDAVEGQRERVVVACDGDLGACVGSGGIAAALDGCTVVPQRGDSFAERLVRAHEDAAAARPGEAVVQIGMDTPQVTGSQLVRAAGVLDGGEHRVVLGPAEDGGWWLLGLTDPRDATALRPVPMSCADTAARTRLSFEQQGRPVELVEPLRDVDTWADALDVARRAPGSRFAAAVEAVRP